MSKGFTQNNNTQHSTYKIVIIFIFLAVALIAIANIICVLAMCYPEWFGIEISKELSNSEIIQSTILSDGIAIIGLAVAVWTGLNIANLIEKREVDKLQQRVRELNEEIKERWLQQNQVEKDRLLHEMLATSKDEATNELIKIFSELPAESEIPFLRLLDVEQKFRNVYELHRSEFNQDENLCEIANGGISFANEILKYVKEPKAELYLRFRIAEFHFYMGYCYLGRKRLEHFRTAIEKYEELANGFYAYVPEFVSSEVYPNINYLPCKKNRSISAYFCNTLGEAYSEIEREKKQLLAEGVSEDELKSYGLKAVFYCAYANKLVTNSVYKRNLGCAIERTYDAIEYYEELEEIYSTALMLSHKNVSNFKTLVSLYDKYVNYILHIESIAPTEKRKNRLCDKGFARIRNSLSINPQKPTSDMMSILEGIHTVSKQAKAIHPSESVGYQYDCIYYRDMCAIYGNHTLIADSNVVAEMKDIAKTYLDKAEENWAILSIIAPYDSGKPKVNPMTQILRNDLDDLRNLL